MLLAWGALWLLFVFLLCDPINRFFLRAAILGTGFLLWLGGLLLARRLKPSADRLLGLLSLLAFLALLGPGRPVDASTLRAEYVRSLSRYQDTPYLWGGTSSQGIDCSGLVERALIDAYLSLGWRGRPQLLRAAFDLWWHRAAANALRDGYHGLTREVLRSTHPLSLTEGQLQAGDLLIPENGEHVLAYLGSGEWIEADPVAQKVLRLEQQDKGLVWLQHPARIVRWNSLGGRP